MHADLFKIGPLTISTYGAFIALGIISAYFVIIREARKQGIAEKVFSDIFFLALVFGFLGARILYIIVEWKMFVSDPLGIIFSRSGFVFYGGVLAGVGCIYLLAHKLKIKFLKLADIFVIGVPLAHSLGRLGCFFYGCCYGNPTISFLGVLFPPSSPAGFLGVKVVPLQLISSLFLILLFFCLLFLKKKKKKDGQLLLYYILAYTSFRFIIEFFRGDPRGNFFFLSTSQVISIMLLTGALWWGRSLKRSS